MKEVMQEKSPRTLLRQKIKSNYGLSVNKTQLYRLVCEYNDKVLNTKNFTEAVSVLNDNKFELSKFAEYAEAAGVKKVFIPHKENSIGSDMRSYMDV